MFQFVVSIFTFSGLRPCLTTILTCHCLMPKILTLKTDNQAMSSLRCTGMPFRAEIKSYLIQYERNRHRPGPSRSNTSNIVPEQLPNWFGALNTSLHSQLGPVVRRPISANLTIRAITISEYRFLALSLAEVKTKTK